jgi:hypothetical protein
MFTRSSGVRGIRPYDYGESGEAFQQGRVFLLSISSKCLTFRSVNDCKKSSDGVSLALHSFAVVGLAIAGFFLVLASPDQFETSEWVAFGGGCGAMTALRFWFSFSRRGMSL